MSIDPGTPSPSRTVQEEIDQEIVNRIIRSGGRLPLLLVANVLIALAMFPFLPWQATALWVLLLVLVLLTRRHLYERARTDPSLSVAQRMRIAIQVSWLLCLTWVTPSLAFPWLAESARASITVIVTGLAIIATINCTGYPRLVLPCALMMAALIPAWALSPVPSGGQPWVERSLAVLIFFFVLIFRSIAKSIYATLIESHAIRLREHGLNQQLNAALDRAQRANSAKTRFLAAASHDLRQPLHTLSMLAATLALRPLDARSAAIVRLLNDVTGSLASQLDGLLDVSKLDAGVVQVHAQPVALDRLLEGLLVEMRPLASAQGLRVEWSNRVDGPASCATDPTLLMRVLRNLIDNAIKFTPDGWVRVTLEPEAQTAYRIVIEDSGIGMSEGEQELVFQEFYQIGNAERDRSRGLGLGLSIVARLVNLLDLQLDLASSPGRGTRFSLRLPRVEFAPSPTPAEAVDAELARYDLMVLVVDDETQVLEGARLLLEELGCQCALASGLVEVRTLLAEGLRPDLVLTDFRLRDSDSGLAVIAEVRAQWPHTPAVLVSGDTAPDRLREAEAARIELLHKPLSLEDLRKQLERVAQGRRVAAEAVDRGADRPS